MTSPESTSGVRPVTESLMQFVWLMFRANMRHLQTAVLSLATPVAIALLFLITSRQISPPFIPLIFIVSVIFAGSTLGTRLIVWREQKIFRRLAVTPTSIGQVVFGLLIAQLAVSITQALILLVILILMGVHYTLPELIVTIWALVAACFCFTALGPVIATVIRRADIMSYAYLFVAMPMTLLSGMLGSTSFQQPLSTLIEILPTTLLANLLRVVQAPVSAQTVIVSSLGLLMYGALFMLIIRLRERTFIE